MSSSYQWLGVAGLVIKAGSESLAIDPFLTRPTLFELLHPLASNVTLVRERIPACNYVLVTHAHYDHLLDVQTVLSLNSAEAYGSSNTCQILRSQAIPAERVHEIMMEMKLTLGQFEVEVLQGQHSPIPLSRLFNGEVQDSSLPPRYAWDYKMDVCLGYCITVQETRFLVCAAEPVPAEVLFVVAQEPKDYYVKMLTGVQPKYMVPIHWDNFTRPPGKPLRRFTRPSRMSLGQLARLAEKIAPGCKVIIPELGKMGYAGELGSEPS
jgi:L-ascorbate metabolism protein UlaG (beta-lactamase superfamily)